MGIIEGIWIHQFDKIDGHGWDALRSVWPGEVYVKALDGLLFMSTFDRAANAVDCAAGSCHGDMWSWADVGAIPWTVPTAIEANAEGIKTALLAEQAGRLILDLEPYEGFWRGDHEAAVQFCQALDRGDSARIEISLDYRRLPFPDLEFHNRAAAYHPQVYWTTFRRPWWEVLEDCASRLAPYNTPIIWTLPGNAEPQAFRDALWWIAERGETATVWVWQTIRPENWETIMADYTPPEDPDNPCADLINLVGYLQGDVAAAIRDPLDHILKTTGSKAAKRWAQEALNAVSELENAGK